MIDPFWLGLIIKMAASAAIVVLASLVVERSGPFIGALIATLPISAGPAYIYLALDHGPDFIAASALASFAVCAATAPFVVVYARLAQRQPLAISLAAALLVWLAVALLVDRLPWNFLGALAFNALLYGGCLLLAWPPAAVAEARPLRRRWWDIPLRALTVMAVAGAVVVAGRLFGPDVAGLLALLPVVLSSMAIVLHPRVGGAATAAVMLHSLPGMLGFTLGVGALQLGVKPLGTTTALLLGLAICVGWNLGLFALRRSRGVRA